MDRLLYVPRKEKISEPLSYWTLLTVKLRMYIPSPSHCQLTSFVRLNISAPNRCLSSNSFHSWISLKFPACPEIVSHALCITAIVPASKMAIIQSSLTPSWVLSHFLPPVCPAVTRIFFLWPGFWVKFAFAVSNKRALTPMTSLDANYIQSSPERVQSFLVIPHSTLTVLFLSSHGHLGSSFTRPRLSEKQKKRHTFTSMNSLLLSALHGGTRFMARTAGCRPTETLPQSTGRWHDNKWTVVFNGNSPPTVRESLKSAQPFLTDFFHSNSIKRIPSLPSGTDRLHASIVVRFHDQKSLFQYFACKASISGRDAVPGRLPRAFAQRVTSLYISLSKCAVPTFLTCTNFCFFFSVFF
jgi:hypothetical protein